MDFQVISDRIARRLEELSRFTSTPGNGVTRFPFTDEARRASEYLAECMRGIGLQVRMDNSGSVIGRWQGESNDTVLIGSHLDSVRNGGAYDGIAGVICALEAVSVLKEKGVLPHYSVEVIATNDEEGSRFKSGLFTGKVLLGRLSVSDIQSYLDENGISVYRAMQEYGLAPNEIASHVRTDMKAFLEVHIEQGPVLETERKQIGIVDTIVGIRRALVTVCGRADHVGTMPMNMRMDAVEAACRVIAKIGDRAREIPQAFATVGSMNVEPNIINIIPDKVTFSVDFRGVRQQDIDCQYQALEQDLRRETERFGMSYECAEVLNVPPVDMAPAIRERIAESCRERGCSCMNMVSGAGHDAQVFGSAMPAGMIFVPSIGGRSHCPEEKSRAEDLAAASLIAADTLGSLCGGEIL